MEIINFVKDGVISSNLIYPDLESNDRQYRRLMKLDPDFVNNITMMYFGFTDIKNGHVISIKTYDGRYLICREYGIYYLIIPVNPLANEKVTLPVCH